MKQQTLFTLLCIVAIVMIVRVTPSKAQVSSAPDPSQFEFVEVAGGFNSPLNLIHAGDNRLFVVEQRGKIKIIQNGQVNPTPFLDVASLVSQSGSERGLLGLAFHPEYAQNGWFFINYTNNQGNTVVARYSESSNADVADPSSAVTILTVNQPYQNHNGGHMVFGSDGYLYIGMGDGGSGGDPQNRAQNPQNLLGKILRIDVNQVPYTIPASNPFVGNNAYLPEIWALGVRNPWRFSFDRATGDLYIADVGQGNWEEVNYQPAGVGGLNYGWNVYEGTHRFSNGQLANSTMPFAEYSHQFGCSVTGGYVYRGTTMPDMAGVYLYGDFCSGNIWTAYRDTAGAWQTALFMETDFAISSFGEDIGGELYVIDYGGRVLRLKSTQTPATETPVTPTEPAETETPVTPTEPPPPTDTPEPPTSATLQINVAPTTAAIGSEVNVTLDLLNVTDVYGLQVDCSVNPAVLRGTSLVEGEFNAGNSYIVNTGYQTDGSWRVAATRLQPNAPINGNVAAFSLGYVVEGDGSTEVTCSAIAVDQNGNDLALNVVQGMFDGRTPPIETTEPTPETPEPTEPPPTETPVTPTEPPPPTDTPEPTEPSTISGMVAYQNRPNQAGITVQLLSVEGSPISELVTNADGAYQFTDVAIGVYAVRFSAPQHLRVVQGDVMVESDGTIVNVELVTLRAGDTDDNGVIDLTDATLVGANLENDVPPAPANADLNGDNRINIRDLVLVGGNFNLTSEG